MKKRGHKWILIVLSIESTCFIYGYYWGNRGLSVYYTQQDKYSSLNESIIAEQTKLKKLKKELNNYERNPIYKERIARTTLKMARPHEKVYMIG